MENDSEVQKREESMETKEGKNDISSALEAVIYHMGEMGLYQRLLFVAMLPFGMVWSFVYLSQMFIAATPQEHWCKVPELESLDVVLRRLLSIPGAAEGEYDHCMMYDANWTHVLETLQPPDPDTPTIPCRNGWEFLFDDIPYSTVVSEREWVCDNASLVPWAQTINFMGSIAGGILCGILADMYGRIPILILANMLGFVGGVGTIFTNGFWDFSVCRFIVGMSCDSCFILIYILVLEYVGIKHRTWVANMSIAFFFGGGCMLLPWLALWIADWRNLLWATATPMLLALVTPFLVPESARWLLTQGRMDDVVKVLKKFEKVNGTKIPQDVLDNFIDTAKTTKEKEESVLVLFKRPSLRLMTIFLIIAFMAVALVFDALIRLSENLGLDFFLTFTVSSATEIPSVILLVLLMDRFGRRWLVGAPMLISGVVCVICAFVPRGVASVALAVSARFFTNMAYCAVIQWTPELMPTMVRASGASFVHISAFTAIALSPFIVFSDRAWEGLSLLLMGGVGLVGAAVAFLLPDTSGRSMPQTLDDWELLASTRVLAKKKPKKDKNPEISDAK